MTQTLTCRSRPAHTGLLPLGTNVPSHLREGIPEPQDPRSNFSKPDSYSSRDQSQIPTPPYSQYDPYRSADQEQNPRRLPALPSIQYTPGQARERDPFTAQGGPGPSEGYTVGRGGARGRYQPSRGAQRDARTSQRYLPPAGPQQRPTDRQNYGSPGRLTSSWTRNDLAVQVMRDQLSPAIVRTPPPPTSISHYRESLRRQQETQRYQMLQRQTQPTPRQQQHARQLAVQQQQLQQATQFERIRLEQQAAISAARKAHEVEARESQAKALKIEEEKKVRRIQLQVFVHARPTPCRWKDCQAVLNSWALLEKHIFQSHFHPGSKGLPSPGMKMECLWDDCGERFESVEEVHKHVLIPHMRPFSARCPFHCLFEGEHFNSLMAHISRRHPHATPTDFVPGLMHFKPTPESLPTISPLPGKLPLPPSLSKRMGFCGTLKGFQGETSNKIKRLVLRGCFSGKHPRKDDYIYKKGASAAIGAVIENSRRMSLGVAAVRESKIDNDQSGGGRPASVPVPLEISGVDDTKGVAMIDVEKLAKEAMNQAKKEVVAEVLRQGGDEETETTTSESGVSGSDGSEYKASRSLRQRLRATQTGNEQSNLLSRGDSETEDEGGFKRSLRSKKRKMSSLGLDLGSGWGIAPESTAEKEKGDATLESSSAESQVGDTDADRSQHQWGERLRRKIGLSSPSISSALSTGAPIGEKEMSKIRETESMPNSPTGIKPEVVIVRGNSSS